MSDQCALDKNGSLKDASEIDFYNSESDERPTEPSSAPAGPRRSFRKRDTTKLTLYLEAQKADDDGNPKAAPKTKISTAPRAPRTKQVPETAAEAADEDFDDMPELGDVSDSEDEFDGDSDAELDNDELADLLPTKTVPARGGNSTRLQKRKRTVEEAGAPRRNVTVEEVDDEDGDVNPQNTATNEELGDDSSKQTFKNPIYYFYELVGKNSEGFPGNPGDKHYKCRHGNGRIITVTKKMRYNISGLTTHLRKDFPVMYRLYQALYTRRDEPITPQEIDLARGKIPVDSEAAKLYLGRIETATANIIQSLENQAKKARGDFSQEVFNTLLAQYIVACDQPFDTVEKPEFIRLMEYTHHGSTLNFSIPGRTAITSRIMKMGEDTVAGTPGQELESKVSISLDAWTSPNQHPFLAIVAHYISNEGQLEELLIDFRELVGEHSGENMAEEVFNCLQTYGLDDGRLLGVNMDNASNCDTLADCLAVKLDNIGVSFDPIAGRIRCMPHTAHLSAVKLLEAIGVISKSSRKKAEGKTALYQDSVTASLAREDDEDWEEDDEDEEEGNEEEDAEGSSGKAGKLKSVTKLRKIIRSIRGSPQRRQEWIKEVEESVAFKSGRLGKRPLMLILDVRTRWSSTHQMLRMYSLHKNL
ncbi:ribonuclease H-like domain-containing protein [Favolaschia claudopus]|uniref:Ribonuclease H-like domain-containing protein n=1 Tax=Favolaschia claudopus TaxID=2862362 RepID=A0AAW0AE85_9AGAR